MQVAAEKQGQPVFLQELDHILIVIHGALGCVHPALGQKIVMGNGNHKYSFLTGFGKLLIHPGHGRILDPALHLVIRLILAGIQHQQPVSLIQGIDIAQGITVTA